MRRLKLARIRQQRGWTRIELARRVGCTQPYITLLEQGKKRNPSLAMLKRLAKVLGVTIDELV